MVPYIDMNDLKMAKILFQRKMKMLLIHSGYK